MSAYEEALWITARVTAGLVLVGCGGTIESSNDPPPSNPHPPATATNNTKPPMPEPSQGRIGTYCDPPETACCNAIFDAVDKDWSNYSKYSNVIYPCCKQEDPNFTRAACTPWGPPMPVGMS